MKIPTEQEIKFYDEYHEFDTPDLYREMVKRNKGHIKVLALDLEYTLTSDAVSQFPRPGLFYFLEKVKDLFERIVIFTAVSKEKFREVANNLVSEKDVPEWFADIEYIEWSRKGFKDLSFIPGIESHQALLVDDYKPYVNPSQLFQWVSIPGYETINYHYDKDLNKVLGILELIQLDTIKKERVLAYLEPYVNDLSSGIKRAWLYGSVAIGKADSTSSLKITMEINEKANAKRLKEAPWRSIIENAKIYFKHYFWVKVEFEVYSGKIDDNAILIINEWDNFYAVFTHTQDSIDIKFPDLPGCVGFYTKNGGNLDRFTVQAIELAGEILKEWLKTADQKNIPEKRQSSEELRKQFPDSVVHEISARLPWKIKERKRI